MENSDNKTPNRKRRQKKSEDNDDDSDFVVNETKSESKPKARPKREYKIFYASDEEDLDLAKTKPKRRPRKTMDTVHKCPKCAKVYRSQFPFHKHVQECVHGKKSAASFEEKCSVCLRVFTNPKQLERHMDFHRSKHPDLEQPVNCPTCGEQIKNKIELNLHYQQVHDETKGIKIRFKSLCITVKSGLNDIVGHQQMQRKIELTQNSDT